MSDKTITTPSTLTSTITSETNSDSSGIKWTNVIIFGIIIALVYFFYIKDNTIVSSSSNDIDNELDTTWININNNSQCGTNALTKRLMKLT